MISEDDIRKVRDATDLVSLVGEQVVLRQRNREFWGNCPFHNEKTPSFKVDPATQFYHCFGCGEGGDAFKFVMKTEGVEFPEAVRILAQRVNVELSEDRGEEGAGATKGKKARLYEVCAETAAFYHQNLMRTKSPATDHARAYLAGRDMGGDIARAWKLGYSPGRGELVRHLSQKGFTSTEMIDANVAYRREGRSGITDRFYERVIFPISDLQGRVIAFGGRILGDNGPKYLNSAETLLFHKGSNLFAIDHAKASITARGIAIVVEGYTDVIAMHQAGFTNTVATLGTALTAQHIKLLARFARRVVLLFDGDEAGQRAATRAADLIPVAVSPEAGNKADLFVAVLPGTSDPAELCAAQEVEDFDGANGAEAMQQVLDRAVPLLRFALDRRLATWNIKQPESRARALDDVVRLLVPVKGTLQAADYVSYLADVFLVDKTEVSKVLDRAKPLLTQQGGARAKQGGTQNQQNQRVRSTQQGDAQNQQNQQTQQSHAQQQGARISPTEHLDEQRQTSPTNNLASAIIYERELLLLYIEKPEVRERLREAFGRIEWLDEINSQISEVLLHAGAGESSSDLLSLITVRVPEASSALSATRLFEFGEMSPQRLAGMLMYSLREGQLTQQIRAGKASLRLMDTDKPGYDELYQQIVALQQELSELKKRTQAASNPQRQGA
ncbi:MAG: DNA primase [Coriobacteriales bacterium]|jgi:DNA primase|nr:DNA primase [Coriobacteriales bacterium]